MHDRERSLPLYVGGARSIAPPLRGYSGGEVLPRATGVQPYWTGVQPRATGDEEDIQGDKGRGQRKRAALGPKQRTS